MKKLSLSLLAIALMSANSFAQNPKNYQNALATSLGVLTTSQGYADLNKSFMAQQKIGENQIERHITPKMATFFDLTDNKFFATEVQKPDEKISRINQARRGKENHYDYESLAVADDGSVSSYTICNVDPAKPGESDCHTVNAAVCSEFARQNINESQLSKELDNCTKLADRLESLRKTVTSADLQKANDENLNSMNQSPVKKYIFGDTSLSRKKIDDVPVQKLNSLQLINDVVEMNQSCARLKSGGFISLVQPAQQSPQQPGSPNQPVQKAQ